jgi:hypothetical protein
MGKRVARVDQLISELRVEPVDAGQRPVCSAHEFLDALARILLAGEFELLLVVGPLHLVLDDLEHRLDVGLMDLGRDLRLVVQLAVVALDETH